MSLIHDLLPVLMLIIGLLVGYDRGLSVGRAQTWRQVRHFCGQELKRGQEE